MPRHIQHATHSRPRREDALSEVFTSALHHAHRSRSTSQTTRTSSTSQSHGAPWNSPIFSPSARHDTATPEDAHRPRQHDHATVTDEAFIRDHLIVTDGMTLGEWERERERREAEAAAAGEETGQVLDDLHDASGAGDKFIHQWAEQHDGVTLNDNGQLVLPAERYDELKAQWEEDFQEWWDAHLENELGPLYEDYSNAVAMELRLAALEAEQRGEDPEQAISDKADEIRERDTDGYWNSDGLWITDQQQDSIASDAIDMSEQQVLAESQDVRALQIDYQRALKELDEIVLDDEVSLSSSDRSHLEEVALGLADDYGLEIPVWFDAGDERFVTLSDEELIDVVLGNLDLIGEEEKQTLLEEVETIALFIDGHDAVKAAEAPLIEAIEAQASELNREILIELAGMLGISLPHSYQGEGNTEIALSNEEIAELIAKVLGGMDDPDLRDEVMDGLDDTVRHDLAERLGVSVDDLDTILDDEEALIETLGADQDRSISDIISDVLISMAASHVSREHGNTFYIDTLIFGNGLTPGAIDHVAVALRAGEISSIIDAIESGDIDDLSDIERELLDSGDHIGLALLIQLDIRFRETEANIRDDGKIYVEIDGDALTLNDHEYRLMEIDPVTLGLLLKEGIRLEGNDDLGEISVTIDGNALDEIDLDIVGDGFMEVLEYLLQHSSSDGNALGILADQLLMYSQYGMSRHDRSSIAAHDKIIRDSILSEIEATSDVDERWKIFYEHADATLVDRQRLWNEVQGLLLDQGHYDDLVRDILSDLDNQSDLGGELASFLLRYSNAHGVQELDHSGYTSPEQARLVLTAIINHVDLNSLHDTDGTNAFYEQLSALVEIADSTPDSSHSSTWSERVAEWWTSPLEQRDGGSEGHLWNPVTHYEFYPTHVENTVESGFGSSLSEAVSRIIDEREYEDKVFTPAFILAEQSYRERLNNAPLDPLLAREAYENFEDRKHNLVPNYFDRIMAPGSGLGEAHEVVHGDELRDLIAAGMDLDWRNDPADLAKVDAIMKQIFVSAGIDEEEWADTSINVTVIPYVYASERDGWMTGALFSIDGPSTESTRAVGTINPSIVTITEENQFVIDGGAIAGLADQAWHQNKSIDDITKEQPWKFDSVKHFQDKNYLSENGQLYLPHELGTEHGLDMEAFSRTSDGNIQIGVTAAAIETTGEKVMKWFDIAATVAMFVPVGGLMLSGALRGVSWGVKAAHTAQAGAAARNGQGFLQATVAAKNTRVDTWAYGIQNGHKFHNLSYRALWGGLTYTSIRGGQQLAEMKQLGMDIDWSNPMARNIYIQQLGTIAGGWSMIGSRLTQKALNNAAPGVTNASTKLTYHSTQTANFTDLTTGGYLILDGLPAMSAGGEDASTFDRLLFASGVAQLVMGTSGMSMESKRYHAHQSQTYHPTTASNAESGSSDVITATPLDWSRRRDKSGEDSRTHVLNNHGLQDGVTLKFSKPQQSFFYGDPIHHTEKAWSIAQQQGIEPIKMPGTTEMYVVPYPNAGFMTGRSVGGRQNLDHITISVKQNTNTVVTAFPSGRALTFNHLKDGRIPLTDKVTGETFHARVVGKEWPAKSGDVFIVPKDNDPPSTETLISQGYTHIATDMGKEKWNVTPLPQASNMDTGTSSSSGHPHLPSPSHASTPIPDIFKSTALPSPLQRLSGSPSLHVRGDIELKNIQNDQTSTPEYQAVKEALSSFDPAQASAWPFGANSLEYRHIQHTETPPSGRARLYHFEDMEALNHTSKNGDIPPGHHVHVIRSRAPLNTFDFTMSNGHLLNKMKGVVDDSGHIQWKGNPPKHLNGLYIIVTDMSSDQVAFMLNGNGKILFSEYTTNGTWAHPSSQASDTGIFVKVIDKLLMNDTRASNKKIISQLSRKDKIAAATLGTGFFVGPILSESPTAASLSQLLRGTSMIIRGKFEDASSIGETQHIPTWGRILRGVEFYTTMVNLPNTLKLGEPTNPGFADGTYGTGMALYSSKAFYESITGQPLGHHTDDFALPVFAAGGADGLMTYASNSTGDYDAIVAVSGDTGFLLGATMLYRDTKLWKNKIEPFLLRLTPNHQLPIFEKSSPHFVVDKNTSLLASDEKRKADWATILGFGTVLAGTGLYGLGKVLFEDSKADEKESTTGIPPMEGEDEGSEPPLLEEESLTQRVILPRDGLHLRDDHSMEALILATLAHGAFLDATGLRKTDAEGNEWIFVQGTASDGQRYEGWVMEEYTQDTEDRYLGAMGDNGRINPELEDEDYPAVDVEEGQTMGGIAIAHGHSVKDVVLLNMDHIIDPNALFPGDRVYLPKPA